MDQHDANGPAPGDDAQAERGRVLVEAAVRQARAPLALRERLEADRRRTAPARRRRRIAAGGAVSGVLAGALAAVLLVAPGGTPGAPTVVQAAALAAAPPSGDPPAQDPRSPALLQAAVDGVRFPAWRAKFGWRAVGDRTQQLEGRTTRTVSYRNPRGAVAGYTIVAGDALEPPAGAQAAVVEGTRLLSFRRSGRWVVTWERQGRTCVLAAPVTVPLERVRELAAWRAKGAIAF